jgi:hypothetical protein
MRRIGVLMSSAGTDPEGTVRLTALQRGLQELGWNVGRNVQIDVRWGAANADDIRKYAAELVAFAPDAILGRRRLPLQRLACRLRVQKRRRDSRRLALAGSRPVAWGDTPAALSVRVPN